MQSYNEDSSSEDEEPLSKRMKKPAAEPKRTPATEPGSDAGSLEFADLVLPEHAAFDALKAARLRVLKEIERPGAYKAFHIVTDRQLCQMVRRVPTTLDELRSLPGFGPTRVEEHGGWLLASLEPFVDGLHDAHAELQNLCADARRAAKQDAAMHRSAALLKSKEEAKAAGKAARTAEKQARDDERSAQSRARRDEWASLQGVDALPNRRLSGRQYLNVHILEKDIVKGLGARWDAHVKLWWIPPGIERAPFRRWLEEDKA